MTTFNTFGGRNRDQQDFIERHVFGEVEHTSAGAIVKVRGTGSEDEEAPILSTGVGYNFPKNFNTEVFLLSHGSDTAHKYALITIPRDKQRPWKAGTGGIQHPTDPNKALEFNEKRTHLTDGNYAVGSGTFEVKDGKVYFRCDVVIDGKLTVNAQVITPVVNAGSESVPGFEA